MRLTSGFKARCLCAMIGSLVLCSNVAASAVEILVDAALDQRSLQIANEVALQIVGAAGSEHSVGLVVYDKVFQRGTEQTVADIIQVERITQLTASITPSEFSNLAVGIEKGISELSSEGGVLLVIGHNDILLSDPAAVTRYRNWLRLVLLPDAASKSVSIILAVPQSAQTSALASVIQEYPNNRVFSFSDTSDAISQLSSVLPFALPLDTQVAEFIPSDAVVDQVAAGGSTVPAIELDQGQAATRTDSSTLTLTKDTVQEAEPAVATLPSTTDVPAQSTQNDRPRSELLVALAVLTLLVVTILVITIVVLKKRRGRHELTDNIPPQAEQLVPSRYLPPKQGIATALTTRAFESDTKPGIGRQRAGTLQGSPDSDLYDKPLNTGADAYDDMEFDLDVTAPRNPVPSDSTTRITGLDATAQRQSDPPKKSTPAVEKNEVDELEELRNVTQHKRQTQTEN